jgi:hypothetical protein
LNAVKQVVRPVVAVQRNRDVFVELETMVRRSVAEAVDDFLRNAVGVLLTQMDGLDPSLHI